MTTAGPENGWLGELLLHPDQMLHQIATRAERVVSSTAAIGAGSVLITVFVLVVAARAQRRRLAGTTGRHIEVLTPPTVDPAGALELWLQLRRLRPAWQRVLFGQPHLGLEFVVEPEKGVAIRFWVPSTTPPGLVERTVESAWPGARTRTIESSKPPLLEPVPSHGRVLIGGEMRLGRRDGMPIRVDYGGGDVVRALIGAAGDLAPNQAVCVQILVRPVIGRRVRRALHSGGRTRSWVAEIAADVLDLITPGPGGRSSSHPARQSNSTAERQLAMERTTQLRAAADKGQGAHYETVIRYAVAVQADDSDRLSVATARAQGRGRADALASAFGAATDHNFYRRRRRLRLAKDLERRHLGRGDILSARELAGIAHLPYGEAGLTPGVQRAGARAVAPTADIASGGELTKPLGFADSGRGRLVGLRVADARHHVHVLGPTGVGKSTLLGHLILADAEAGRAVVCIDPKGDLVTDVLNRLPRRCIDRVVLFDADSNSLPPCINPLDVDQIGIDLAVDNVVTIFHRIYSRYWGPRTDDVLRAGLLTLCARPGVATLADLLRMLTERTYRDRLTRGIADPVLRGFWTSYDELTDSGRAQLIGPLQNKLRAFLLRPFVRAAIAGGSSTVDLGDVLNHGGICLARLPKGSLGEDTARLVGSLIVAHAWQAATVRGRVPEATRKDATLVVDEAHNFLNLSTPVEDMLAEARSLRLSLVLAHQNLSQLTHGLRDAISANARNKIIFTASPEDARELARHTAPWLGEHDLTHLDAYHAAARLMVSGQQAPPFTFATQPLPEFSQGHARDIRVAINHRRKAEAQHGVQPAAPDAALPDDPRRS